ncbi:MAG: tetratricopeptide repeat protein [Gemmatimonadota bacterium]|nr:tetratricopeptide repeat protein [Gemmatimonadota bacterium]
MRLGTETIDIPAGDARYLKEDEYVLPVPVRVLGVYPHAHYVGREISLSAAIPGSAPLTILEIPDWDFNWQDAYRLAEPLRLPAGTTLVGRFVYDNSARNPRNPHRPPQRVVYGPRSEDEMGEIWIQVVPDTPDDLETLATDFARHNLLSKIEGWNHMLSIDPGEPTAHVGLGTVDAAGGRHADAIGHFRAALESRPDYIVAHYNLGVSLERTGRRDEARAEFELVARLDPAHAAAHNNLGILAAEAGRTDEAGAHFEAAVAAEPGDPELLNNLGNARRQSGRLTGAAEALTAALDLAPDYAAARLNLALVAWSRATDPDARVRDATEAVRLAERAVRGAERDYRLLDILAAAYAEAGRFDDAVAAATRAGAYADAAGADRAGIDGRRALYADGAPYRAR